MNNCAYTNPGIGRLRAMTIPATQSLVPVPDTRLSINHGTPWPVVAQSFLDAECSSANTRLAYTRQLRTAFAFLNVETLAELNGAILASYKASVVNSTLSPNSQAVAIAALRAFLKWSRALGAHGLNDDILGIALKMPKAQVRKPYMILSEIELRDIFHVVNEPRDSAILGLMVGAGLRVSEVGNLLVSDIRTGEEGAYVWVRQGKGAKDRHVPLTDDVLRLVVDYLESSDRHLGSDGYLFLARDRAKRKRDVRKPISRSMSSNALEAVVAGAIEAAHIRGKRVSPHSLRHTFAIRFLRASGNVPALSKLLGHSALTVTMRYLDHIQLDELRAAMPRLPLNGS